MAQWLIFDNNLFFLIISENQGFGMFFEEALATSLPRTNCYGAKIYATSKIPFHNHSSLYHSCFDGLPIYILYLTIAVSFIFLSVLLSV
jgi:hypothetical protein